MGYNGWSNYETWVMNLYFTGNYDTNVYDDVLNMAESSETVYELSEKLNDYVDIILDNTYLPAGFMREFIVGAVETVDFYELAEDYFERVEHTREENI